MGKGKGKKRAEKIGTKEPKDAEDRAAPNTAMILLLQAILDLVGGAKMEWILNHIHLRAESKNGHYSAFTDGGLRSMDGQGKILAIVEAKRRQRISRGSLLIQMQEGAEARRRLDSFKKRHKSIR